MDDLDLVETDAEAVIDHLGEARFMPLAMRMRAGQHLDGADEVDPHLSRFPQADAGTEGTDRGRWSEAAGFAIAGQPDATELAAPGGFGFARLEPGIVGGLQRGIERSFVTADVVAQDDRRL